MKKLIIFFLIVSYSVKAQPGDPSGDPDFVPIPVNIGLVTFQISPKILKFISCYLPSNLQEKKRRKKDDIRR